MLVLRKQGVALVVIFYSMHGMVHCIACIGKQAARATMISPMVHIALKLVCRKTAISEDQEILTNCSVQHPNWNLCCFLTELLRQKPGFQMLFGDITPSVI